MVWRREDHRAWWVLDPIPANQRPRRHPFSSARQVTRAGGNDPLFDQMFAGLRLSGVAATQPLVDGVTSRGSDQLRLSTATRTNLANGNFVAVANALITPATLTIAAGGSGIQGLSPGPAFAILHNGCDRLANGLAGKRCFPEN